MNTNDIKIVLKVCETGSLAKAANLLFLTPQATSVAVKRVETELGVDLFVRAAGGMSMTDYGRDFQEKAAHLMGEMLELKKLFHLDIHNRHGVLKVAFSQGIIAMLGVEKLLKFYELFPNFKIEVIEGSDKKVEELVLADTVDLGISVGPVNYETFDENPWCAFDCCAFVNEQSALGEKLQGRDRISISELEGEPLVLENKDFKIYRELKKYCKAYGFDANIYFETVEIDNALSIAAGGHATAIIPVPIAMRCGYQNMKTVRFQEPLQWDWHFIKRKNIPASQVELEFMDYLKHITKEKGWNEKRLELK